MLFYKAIEKQLTFEARLGQNPMKSSGRSLKSLKFHLKKIERNKRKRKFKVHEPEENNSSSDSGQGGVHHVSTKPDVIVSPECLCIVTKPDDLIQFCKKIIRSCKNNRHIKLNLSKVKVLEPQAMFVIIATIKHYADKEICWVEIEPPINLDCKRIIFDSGAIRFFKHRNGLSSVSVNPGKGKMGTWNTSFYGKALESLCQEAKDIFGDTVENEKGHSNLYAVLAESMSNVIEHAYNNNNGAWWLYSYYDEVTKTLQVSLLDHGKGIYKTLPLKFLDLSTWIDSINDEKTILLKAFEGQLKKKTSTGKKNRGRGLAEIFKKSKEHHFSTFIAISRGVKIFAENSQAVDLKDTFPGTIYYWEFKPNTN